MKAIHLNVAFMGGTVVIAAMVLVFVQTPVDLCSATVQEVQSADKHSQHPIRRGL